MKLIPIILLSIAPLVLTAQVAPPVANPFDLECLAANVYHEARGEPFLGQILVAKVTLNRAREKSVCDAVYEPKQFSWTDKPKAIKDSNAYQVAMKAAKAAYNYVSPVTHFHNTSVQPRWTSNLTRVVTVNNHVFYR